MRARIAFGADIGATKIRFLVARFSDTRVRIIDTWSNPTPKTKLALVSLLRRALAQTQKTSGVRFRTLGIGIPGPIEKRRGRVLTPPNAPQFRGLAARELSRHVGSRVLFENDANLFALGESVFGAGQGFSRVLGITVGSGVGGGLVIDKKLERGARGHAGEIGHMIISADGARCACGGRGHLESYVSARGFRRLSQKAPRSIEADARAEKRYAVRIFHEIGDWLGVGIASAMNLWDPDVVVVGGGIGQAGELLLRPARQRIKKEILAPETNRTKIVKAKLGRLGGAVGAAYLSVI